MKTIETTTSEVIDTINKLIEICRDGQYGFELASKGIDDALLRSELMQYSQQRHEFADDLREALADVTGESSTDHGSMAGALHRGWINIKQALTSRDRLAILSECERGEDAAVEAYRDAIGTALPDQLAGLVQTQMRAVQRVHDRVRALRDADKAD